MNGKFLIFILLSLFLLFFFNTASADDSFARKIMELVEDRDDGDDEKTEMRMILIDKGGKKRVRHMLSYAKDKGEDVLKLMFFISPADVKDTGFLTYDYDDYKKDDDQWLYLPALKKSKRIASTDKSGSFMGSDFSYADMTKRQTENYEYTFLKESKVRGKNVAVIKSVPRTEDIVKEYGYTQSVVFVRRDINMVVRAVHWLDEGNKMKYMDIEELEVIDGIHVAKKVKMITKRGKLTLHTTFFLKDKVRFNENLGYDFFSIRRMEKGI